MANTVIGKFKISHLPRGRTSAIAIDMGGKRGPRVWVECTRKEVRVFLHPDDGDPSDLLYLNRRTKRVKRVVEIA